MNMFRYSVIECIQNLRRKQSKGFQGTLNIIFTLSFKYSSEIIVVSLGCVSKILFGSFKEMETATN